MWRPRANFPASGWRRTAVVNAGLMSIVSVALVALLGRSAAVAGSISSNTVVYRGSCDVSGRINVLVHLVLNIISTLVIASSNFFMQVLNSPTRDEVDKAHAKGLSLEIGVPSIRNTRHLARLKTVLWLLFILSSVPIHLFFNSSVFETDYQGKGFFMAMASDPFVHGAEYHGLGASLVYAGAPSSLWAGREPNYRDPCDSANSGWGCLTNLTQYRNQSSPAALNLSSISTAAAAWTRLDGKDCWKQYGTCTARRDYGDVVLVVNTQLQDTPYRAPADTVGFTADDIFNMTQGGVPVDPYGFTTDELRAHWDRFGPVSEPNPLWFSAWCEITSSASRPEICTHGCFSATGNANEMNRTFVAGIIDSSASWTIPLRWYNSSKTSTASPVVIPGRPSFNQTSIGSDASIEITHCYAEPLEHACKVAVSNGLLLAVTVFAIAKTILSFVTAVYVRGNPLVTPGDAMASFLNHPDRTTEGKATLEMSDCDNQDRVGWQSLGVRSRHWRKEKSPRISAAVPYSAWLRTYGLIVLVLIITILLLNLAVRASPIRGSFDHDVYNGLVTPSWLTSMTFAGKILVANAPQQILSLCYFAYNALITRACAEQEWNLYSLSYRPLRVSHPEGEQVSSYRLQLPYRYSIPLLIAATLLHWLVSNAIYVFIIEGGYVTGTSLVMFDRDEEAYVGVGYSSLAILVVVLLSVFLSLLPLCLLRRLKGRMVICGSNSAVISASCHASTLRAEWMPEGGNHGFEMLPLSRSSSRGDSLALSSKPSSIGPVSSTANLVPDPSSGNEDMHREAALAHISRSRVRWGVVQMPSEWHSQLGDAGNGVGHLTFGTIEQGVTDPQLGKEYI